MESGSSTSSFMNVYIVIQGCKPTGIAYWNETIIGSGNDAFERYVLDDWDSKVGF